MDGGYIRANGLAGDRPLADHAGASAQRAIRNAELLDDRLNKLSLICWAMWSLIQESTELTEDDLLTRVRELDALDGNTDGRVTHEPLDCSHCGRVISEQHNRCLYCGAERPIQSAFDMIL